MRGVWLSLVLFGCGTSAVESTDASLDATDAGGDGLARKDAAKRDVGVDIDVPDVDAGLNNCGEMDFVDRSAPGDDRTIVWQPTVVPRCLTISQGQLVTWDGSLMGHPLASQGGDMPTPITTTNMGTSVSFTFPDVGDYGFVCLFHPPMKGVIRVR